MPDSMTQILSSGPPGTKVNIAVLGDGFADGADQPVEHHYRCCHGLFSFLIRECLQGILRVS